MERPLWGPSTAVSGSAFPHCLVPLDSVDIILSQRQEGKGAILSRLYTSCLGHSAPTEDCLCALAELAEDELLGWRLLTLGIRKWGLSPRTGHTLPRHALLVPGDLASPGRVQTG